MIIPDNHLTLTTQDDVQQICKPLLDNMPINWFICGRFYSNYGFFGLHTNSESIKQIFACHSCPDFGQLKFTQGKYFLLSPDIAETLSIYKDKDEYQKNLDISNQYDCYHRLFLLNRTKSFIELTGFGMSAKHEQGLHFLMNHFDLLENFAEYFKEKAADLLKLGDSNQLIYKSPGITKAKTTENEQKNEFLSANKETFLEQMKSNQIIIAGKKLTPREIACLKYVCQGLTAKEAARVLNVSPRTVEAHILNIKRKLGCRNVIELCNVYFGAQQNNAV